MQIVKLSVPVPTIGPAVDVHVRTLECACVAFCAAYDRQAGAWHFPESPEAIADLLAAAGVVLR